MAKIDTIEIQDMVSHWLGTPTNGYLGSRYGQDVKSLLQTPQSEGLADDVLNKLRSDVPVLTAIPTGSLNLFGIQSAPDKLDLVIDIAGTFVTIPNK